MFFSINITNDNVYFSHRVSHIQRLRTSLLLSIFYSRKEYSSSFSGNPNSHGIFEALDFSPKNIAIRVKRCGSLLHIILPLRLGFLLTMNQMVFTERDMCGFKDKHNWQTIRWGKLISSLLFPKKIHSASNSTSLQDCRKNNQPVFFRRTSIA